ncbi:DUF2591 family protein [Edwardsiella ictaluri]|uniref:phage protein NinX family protein n=1 Tax=Edwardsiella ictaluri TaxID=67780 RepID=UPI0018DCD10A|nr:phage protein NinX family protein [Edwardsiella ictaluri]QPW26455.1 DUF2591 family protein [Edwardsiella ictaluri]
MNYAEMSDYQINNLIHNHEVCVGEYRLEFMDDGRIKWTHGNGLVVVTGHKKYDENLKDYCNNPDDMWPLIVENGMSLAFWDGEWEADCGAYWVDGTEWKFDGYRHTNPLRAAAIAYLMMKERD